MEDLEIKQEVLSSDDEFEFQFAVDDCEYDAVMRELRAKDDSDLEELDGTMKHDCPYANCRKSFARKHNWRKHMSLHEVPIDHVGAICHKCGKNIKGVLSLHMKTHE